MQLKEKRFEDKAETEAESQGGAVEHQETNIPDMLPVVGETLGPAYEC